MNHARVEPADRSRAWHCLTSGYALVLAGGATESRAGEADDLTRHKAAESAYPLHHVDMNAGWEGIIRIALVAHSECSVLGLAVPGMLERDMETCHHET